MPSSQKKGRNSDGTFAKGFGGRPRGARNKTTRAIAALLDGEANKLTRKAIEMALEGDTVALRLCLERLHPPRKDAPIPFDLPKMSGAKSAAQAIGAVLEGVARGDLTPSEAGALADLVEGYRKALETTELEVRLTALEARQR
jgi:hypothetical protein